MASEDFNDDRQTITRRRGACQLCREKKVRCNGRKPCSFCDKHQAACEYQPPAPKLLSQASGKTYTSQSTITASSQHTGTPVPTGRHHYDSTVNYSDSGYPSESGDLDNPPWSPVPDYESFDESVNFMDLVLGASTRDTESSIDPQLFNLPTPPSTSNATTFDIHALDWSLPPNKQGDASAVVELDSHGPEQVADSTAVSFQPVIPVSLDGFDAMERPTAGMEPPTKRRRVYSLPSTPVLGRGERLKSVLFPTATSTKTSSTNIPSSYNPYVSALFPSSRRAEQKFGESNKSVVKRIVTKLLSRDYLLGLPTLWADSFADDEAQEALHLLENSSALPMEKLVKLCFNEPWGVGCFLQKSDILMLIQKYACSEREGDHDAIAITDVFLLGIMATWGATIGMDEHPGLACVMATQIMDLRHAVVLEPDSITKFLALVAMLQYTFKAGLAQFPAILAETVSVVQSLNLHLEAGLHGVCPGPASTIQVKRACWVLFCVDKAYAMRWRTFSLLPDIEYDPPPLRPTGRDFHGSCLSHRHSSQENDWLLSQCRYAKICARIRKGFASLSIAAVTVAPISTAHDNDDYGVADHSTSTEGIQPTPREKSHELFVHELLTDLHTWYESVPREGRPLSLTKAATSTSSERHIAIGTAYQYHEAVLVVLSLLNQLPTSSSLALNLPQLTTLTGNPTCSAATILLESIRAVFTLSNHVLDIQGDRTLLHVPTLALCTLAIEHVKGNPAVSSVPSGQRECRILFAMAYGFFGRLARMLPHSDFFDCVAGLFEAVKGC